MRNEKHHYMRDGTPGVWIVRSEAEAIGRYLAAGLEARCYAPANNRQPTNREMFAGRFREHRQWVLVMATGIAVRYLQGLPSDKQVDPGVVVLDEGCRFAISLLSGHEGGANKLAYRSRPQSGENRCCSPGGMIACFAISSHVCLIPIE